MGTEKKKVVAVLSDLMFTVKIQGAAREAGFEPVFVKTQADVLDRARQGAALIILDLNERGLDVLATIAALKADDETRIIPQLGYVSHIQIDRRQAAEAAGCDVVVARSVFVERLPKLLNELAIHHEA